MEQFWSIVIPFYRKLHCGSLLQKITSWFLSTEDYIVIPLYRGLHCDSLLQKITWWFLLQRITLWYLLQNITLWFPFAKNYIVVPIYTRPHNDFFYKGFLKEIHKDIHKESLKKSLRKTLYCDSFIQKIPLWYLSKYHYIVIPLYRRFHCDSLY